MATLLDGLHGYEIVMLGLGIILFIVLLFGLVGRLRSGAGVTSLLPFFGLTIAMVGYPSVQSITIGKDLIKIQKVTTELSSSPTDVGLRQTLDSTIQRIKGRPISSPLSLTIVAEAQYALGHDSEASQSLQKVLEVNPNLADARTLQQKIGMVEKVANLTQKVESEPLNTSAKASLESTLSEASKTQIANPNALTEIARGQAAVGNYSQAIDTANKAVVIAPNSPARRLPESLKKSTASTSIEAK